MNQVFTINPGEDGRSEMAIHPETAVALGLNKRKFAHLSFGNQKSHVNIIPRDEVGPADIQLSPGLITELHLPDYPVFEIRVHGNEIVFGPYIGLLISAADQQITAARFTKLLVYSKEYARLHGALVAFALDKVDRQRRLIEGYCFHPDKQYWQKGIFPYPAAIFRTIGLTPEWKNHFLAELGDKVFNSRFFSKWEMYCWLAQEPAIRPHLPETVLYQEPQDIVAMLAKHSRLYIKPIRGLRGRGIFQVSRINHQWRIRYREKKVNHDLAPSDAAGACEYMRRHFRPGRHLIQQAVDLLESNGGIIDFRCVVLKNQANSWVCRAVIGRCGVADSIVSNISSGGAAFTAEAILRKALPTSRDLVAALLAKIPALAVAVCNQLDEYGLNCGALGVDIGVDRQGRLWLIEINNRDPDPTIALDIKDTQLFYALKSGPLFYAKYLAGFPALGSPHHAAAPGPPNNA